LNKPGDQLPIVMPLPVPFAVRVVNAYLLPGDPITLVDPGAAWDPTRQELDSALAARGLEVKDIERILVTHQHHDHLGYVAELQERSGADVVAHELLRPFLGQFQDKAMEDEDSYQASVMRAHGVPEELIEKLYERSRGHRPYVGSFELGTGVQEGDVVEAGGFRLRVYGRPGHSPSDLLFVDEEGGFAIGGDHLLAGITPNPVVHRPLDRRADPLDRFRSLPAYVRSLEATALVGADVFLPGHGPTIDDHTRLAITRVGLHEQRKEDIAAKVAEGGTAFEIARRFWRNTADEEPFLVLSETLGHLDLLEDEGRLTVEELEGGVVRYRSS
jgi:glyoxylase-like metal-dependent hydrolase (beta-lactamase superfamily II)